MTKIIPTILITSALTLLAVDNTYKTHYLNIEHDLAMATATLTPETSQAILSALNNEILHVSPVIAGVLWKNVATAKKPQAID